jgi:hypothetical protein
VSEIPSTAWATCHLCGEPVDLRDPLLLRQVTGYDRHREQGGQNHVRHRRATGRYLCGKCDVKLSRGLAIEQEALL